MAMPSRVEQMSTTLSSLEAGDLKLRVRALEVERAARRAQIMQVPFPPVQLSICTAYAHTAVSTASVHVHHCCSRDAVVTSSYSL